jgi:hypothetical protein
MTGSTGDAGIHSGRDRVSSGMNGAVILLVALAIPYLAFNVRRLYHGRPWALGICQVAKEWEQRERDRRLAMRAALMGSESAQAGVSGHRVGTDRRRRRSPGDRCHDAAAPR